MLYSCGHGISSLPYISILAFVPSFSSCDIGSFVGVNVKQKLFPTPKTLPTFAKLYMWMTIGLRIAPKVLVVQLLVQLLVLLLAAHLEVLEVPEGNTDVDAIRKAIKAAAKLHGNKILKLFFFLRSQ